MTAKITDILNNRYNRVETFLCTDGPFTYLGLLVDINKNRYMFKPTSMNEVNSLLIGEIDFRNFFLISIEEGIYLSDVDNYENIELKKITEEDFEFYLPEEGIYYEPNEA